MAEDDIVKPIDVLSKDNDFGARFDEIVNSIDVFKDWQHLDVVRGTN